MKIANGPQKKKKKKKEMIKRDDKDWCMYVCVYGES